MKKESIKIHTFTFIVDYEEGTYISQLQAASPRGALNKWGRTFDFSMMPRMRSAKLDGLRKRLAEERPTRITGTKGVWCACGRFANKLMLINIVRTASAKP